MKKEETFTSRVFTIVLFSLSVFYRDTEKIDQEKVSHTRNCFHHDFRIFVGFVIKALC